MTINTSIGLIGVALQEDRDTPASAPAFVHGLTGGKVFNIDRSVSNANVSCGVRAGTDSYVKSIVPGLDFDTYGYADVLPLYFYAALGGIASAPADAADLFEHTVVLGDELPFLTFWGRIGNEFTRTEGCKIDQFEMEFEGNDPLAFGVTALGLGATMGLESIPGAGDPSCFDGYFVPTNGIFKLDTSSDEPAEADVLKASLSITNSCKTFARAGRITPGNVSEGKLTTAGKVTVQPADLGLYKQMVTGSKSGTTPSGTIVYGSFYWEFTHSKVAGLKLTIEASRVPFTAEFPEVDPEGGAAEMEFSFEDIGIDSKGGSPITVKITNKTPSYTA